MTEQEIAEVQDRALRDQKEAEYLAYLKSLPILYQWDYPVSYTHLTLPTILLV